MARLVGRTREAIERFRTRRLARERFLEFINWVDAHPSPRWVFRGHSQVWPIRPSVGRIKSYSVDQELLLFQEFRRAALPYLDRSILSTDWDWLAVAQHHGLPTRLVDWTWNALVAFYFASHPSPRGKRAGEVVAIDSAEIGYYHPEERGKVAPFEITEARFLRPSAVANRITSQKGLFSIHPVPNRPWQLRERTERFEVAAPLKADFRRLLFAIGVDDAFLMADLDGLTKTLRWRVENGMLGE